MWEFQFWGLCWKENTLYSFICMCFYYSLYLKVLKTLVVLGFELRTSDLLDRCTITWATPLALKRTYIRSLFLFPVWTLLEFRLWQYLGLNSGIHTSLGRHSTTWATPWAQNLDSELNQSWVYSVVCLRTKNKCWSNFKVAKLF
jgi:hypothetical protein